MIGTDTLCVHSDAPLADPPLYGCMKNPEFSCEAYCTNQPLCLGYTYQASSGICVLFPKKPTDGSVEICSPGFDSLNGKHAETINDIVPSPMDFSTVGFNCYRKASGNNIVEFEV